MIFHLFDRELKNEEILGCARELGIDGLPLMHNPMEQPGGNLPAPDAAMLKSLVRMLERSRFRLQLAYEQTDVLAPLMGVYIFGDHLLGLMYGKNGVRPAEILNPKDFKQLLFAALAALPMPPCEDDARMQAKVSLAELARILDAGEDACAAFEGDCAAHIREMQAAYTNELRIACALDDAWQGAGRWYALKAGNTIYCLFEDEGGCVVSRGSYLPLVNAVSRRVFACLKESILAVRKAQES